jgi:hypothetical protein
MEIIISIRDQTMKLELEVNRSLKTAKYNFEIIILNISGKRLQYLGVRYFIMYKAGRNGLLQF